MSYCVNCGVELDKPEKKCPLCGVKVINPRQNKSSGIDKEYPENRDIHVPLIDKALWVKLLSIILATPAVICLILNLFYNGTVSWSLYAIGGIAVAWSLGVSPFLFKKPAAIKWIIIDVAAVLGYLKLIEYLAVNTWFLPVALPIVLGAALFTLVITVLIQRHVLKDLNIPCAIFLAIGLLLVGVEIVLDLHFTGTLRVEWSWIVLVSCMAMATTLAVLERQKKAKEKLRRRFHI
ncbi:MAG: DUF6320 domain-containing protein [Bacillota bacterium]|nr:DUF6320 domain-containing protein [Bacillota bacterium]